MATTLIDSVIHWRKKLDRNSDEDVILNVIRKLSKVPITLEILEATHIGKKIRQLSKRDDIVGEKALAVLKKWRDTFANAEKAKNISKPPSVSKKENIDRASGKHEITQAKTVNHQKDSHHKHRHENRSLAYDSSEESSNKYVNGNCNVNNSIDSSPSTYTYEKKGTSKKYTDYNSRTNGSESYNPEYPELFLGDKSMKAKENSYESKSSQKRCSNAEEQIDSVSKSSKTQSTDYSGSDSVNNTESKKSGKKEKHKDKTKDHKSHSNAKKSSDKTKSSCAEAPVSKHSKKENSNAKCNKSKPKVKLNSAEVFTSSEVSFEDCLGFNDIVPMKKKKSAKSQPPAKKPVTAAPNKSKHITTTPEQKTSSRKDSPDSYKEKLHVPKPSAKLDVVDIISTLPETQPNYRPLPQRNLDFYSPKKKEVLTNEDAIRFTSSRREKTAVYSGRKSYFTEVPSLFECCTRILIENIDAIEYMGEVPYFLLKAVLEKCTPTQLFTIENYNPHLLESTNELWEIHCRRDYRLLMPQENETWRELYLRAYDEREKKLKSVTANISASMSKSNPVRQVKLAFVDSIAKPPRDVARRQAKNGTARAVNTVVKAGPSKRPAPPPINSGPSNSNTTFVPKKPKVAPLMAKTLKSMKQCFRR